MKIQSFKAILRAALSVSLLAAAGLAAAAPTMNTFSLTAQRMTKTLQDGTPAPMWGYCSTGSCTASWTPGPTIVVPYDAVNGSALTINLTNNLPVPTSLVILGQLGGGLGSPSTMASPTHSGQNFTTFPANASVLPAGPSFIPPAQGARVRSFGTEVPAPTTLNGITTATTTALVWSNLRPGTYIYETGTLPSLQVPMGLYGVLVVTQAPVAANATATPPTAFVPGSAYTNVAYDADATLLFSEMDPVQNRQVDAAAAAGTDPNKRWNDPTCAPVGGASTCYPAAVNYTPTHFMINGNWFDKTAPQLSGVAAATLAYGNGNVLVRMLNAGSRTHIPTIVGSTMALVAEDGNVPPGNPRLQSEVLLTAGKTVDVLIRPAAAAATSTTDAGNYAPATLPVFDRQLSTSTGNLLDGGQQAFLLVNGASASATAGAGLVPAVVTPTAVNDSFNVPYNTPLTANVTANDTAVTLVTIGAGPTHGTLALNPNGSFTYTPYASFTGADSFTYSGFSGNNVAAGTATVTLNVASSGFGSPPTANADTYISSVASKFSVSRPGVLANDVDPSGYPLIATSATTGNCGSVSLNPDGSFSATKGAGSACSFTYTAQNSQGTQSASANVTVTFVPVGMVTGLSVNLVDANTGASIPDYRWVIQEDLTFKHDVTATPSLTTRTIGTSFHRSHMGVVATGCVGAVSCGSGQSVRVDSTTVDPLTGTLGARHVVTDAEALALQTLPGDVVLDPTKNYYLSILPGDAANPVGGCDPTNPKNAWCDPGGAGHMMVGGEIGSKLLAGSAPSVTIKTQPSPLVTAQLSVYIYEDNSPTNGQNDLGENGLGGFNIILMDPAGKVGDPAGQQTYDAFNMPLTNALFGTPGCPNDLNPKTVANVTSQLLAGGATAANAAAQANLVGAIYTCPNDPNAGTPLADPAKYTLAGHALIKNLTPARYDVIAHPAAAREGAGEIWWQTETLEGTPAQDAFTGINEPKYFQEFGPPGFHTTIGFVNPANVSAYAKTNKLTGSYTISGKITSQHMSRPSDVTLYDAGTYDMLFSTTCRVALNSAGGQGASIATAECAPDGSFTLTNVPSGDYEIAIFDQWLDQIIQTQALTVSNSNVALGNIPVLSWFTQYDQNIYMDLNKNGVYDDGEPGISNVPLMVRYRSGAPSNATLSDSNGNGILVELFPLFNWYVAEADTTRFKQTGVNITVDAGGPVDTTGRGANLWSSVYQATAANPTGCDPTGGSLTYLGAPCTAANTTNRVEQPGALTYGLQGFISQRSRVDWGRTPYVPNENGGIYGLVVYSSTRPFDDQRLNVQTIWEPAVPRVTVNLYKKDKLADGTDTLTLVDTTKTSSWDDYVNLVYGVANGVQTANQYLLGTDGVLRDPATGAAAPAGVTAGKQVNLQCPGQRPDDPFMMYTLAAQNSTTGSADQFRCYDGWHNWNQVQAAPYDGKYQFPSADYIAKHPLTTAQITAGQTLVSLPVGTYVVEAVTPPGYEIVKEEDKNILIGDAFVAPAVQQFGPLASIFILPDQATLNNANPFNPSTGDAGFQSNPTTNLGWSPDTNATTFPTCVGNDHIVPDFLSLFPQAQQVAPFAGMSRPLCDRKAITLNDQMQASANFFVFTGVPMAANSTGIILDDASSEFNAAAPDFGEKASVPFVPISLKDFNGVEINRAYSDQWGAYNMMMPSSWLVNPPTPSGYGPNMLVTCMNDPGPVKDPVTGLLVTDAQYNPAYSTFCYTNPFMPGLATYLDTPVLPIAAFASGYNPPDCALPENTPAIKRVDGNGGVVGPWLPSTGGVLIITSLGQQQVQNPAYAGPFATSGPASVRNITRNYGFGATPGTVKIGTTTLTVASGDWTDGTITATVPANTPTGELSITAANGQTSVDTVTVTVGGAKPVVVSGAKGGTIQAAVDAARPGDLIMVDAGTYNELVIMWKPVRLQGVGAASVIINAAKYPNSKLDGWRTRINQLFSIDGTTGNQTGTAQIDPLPTQEITGGIVLLEPSVLGTEEGAGITVLAKNLPAGTCSGGATSTVGAAVTDSNFLCAPSRIDGISVTGGDAGGGIYVNGWAHKLEIANNRVYGNAGALHGGVRIGVPYLELEALPAGLSNQQVPGFGYDQNINIHHNNITKNGTIEPPAGAGGAGAAISICTGTDGYSIDHNWVCGNYSASDGGGIGHLGFSQNGSITKNTILFNQSFQQTNSTNGGGIIVAGEPAIAGALSMGTGNVKIDANLIRGNFAEGGSGGGIRLQQVNGLDVVRNSNNSALWFSVSITNNMIENNVAGYAGGGISLSDALTGVIDNNTIASNDSAGIAGVVITNPNGTIATGPAQSGTGSPSPAGISTERHTPQLMAAIGPIPNILTVLNGNRDKFLVSSPDLFNNILWKNRSFFYKAVNGVASLCSSNNTGDPAGLVCNQLLPQAATGACMNTTAGAPAYWDIGVVGDATPVPPQTTPATLNIASFTQSGVLFGIRTVTITTATTLDVISGQSVNILGFSRSAFNGSHAILVTGSNTFTYLVTGDTNTAAPTLTAGTVTEPPVAPLAMRPTNSVMTSITGYTGVTAGDPMLLDMYCNGSRVTPEFDAVINPPAVKSLQVAATTDEGNNYINLRYGPLYQAKPTDANGTAFTQFGDYHLGFGSSALDAGATIAAITQDYDGDARPQGSAYDIGADEAKFTSLSGSTLAFGSVIVGQTSAAQVITLNNLTNVPLAITSVALSDATNYSLTNGCVGTVVALGSCTISVTFHPASNGSKPATLTVTDAAGVQTVTLTGAGFTLTATHTPANLTGSAGFGNVQVGTSATLPVKLTNTTPNASLTLAGFTITGTNVASFSQTNNCPASLPAGQSCTINVTFNATATGLRTATLNLNDGASGTQTVGLSGTGVQAVGFSWTNGGTVGAWGTAGGARTITVTNTGNALLTLTGIPVVANVSPGTQFSRTGGTCASGQVIAAGSTCTVIVTRVRPTTGSTIGAGTLTVNDTGAALPAQILPLSGT